MSANSHALIQASSNIGGAFVMSPERREVPMPPAPRHVVTRPEIEEALASHCADARKARDRGNELRVNRRHEQINDLLVMWELSREPVPA